MQSLGRAPRRHPLHSHPPPLPRWHASFASLAPLALSQASTRSPYLVGGTLSSKDELSGALSAPLSSASTLAAALVARVLPPLASGPRLRTRPARYGELVGLELLGASGSVKLLAASQAFPSGLEAARLAWVRAASRQPPRVPPFFRPHDLTLNHPPSPRAGGVQCG